jgi:uncharacterized protein (TIGR00251 family)
MDDLFNITIYNIINNKIILPIHIKPMSKNSAFLSIYNGRLKIAISTPPVNGQANKELIKFLAKNFNIKKADIKILQGLISVYKIIEIPLSAKNILIEIFNKLKIDDVY